MAAPRFNDLIDKWDSKSAVLSIALTQLLRCLPARDCRGLPMRFVIDKGKAAATTTARLLQHAFADGMVLAEEEAAA